MQTKFLLNDPYNSEFMYTILTGIIAFFLLASVVTLICSLFDSKKKIKKINNSRFVDEKKLKKEKNILHLSLAFTAITMFLFVMAINIMNNFTINGNSKLDENKNTLVNTLNITESQADRLSNEALWLRRNYDSNSGYPYELRRTFPNDDGTSRQIVIASSDRENFIVLSDKNMKNEDLATTVKDKG